MQANLNHESYLFYCSNRTQKECLERRLFGHSRKYWGWVQQIKKGTTVFLFNIDSKSLYGPFKAAGDGALNIDPRAWENVRPIEFPAQLSVEWEQVHEIKMASKKFSFLRDGNVCRLTAEQTNLLVNALITPGAAQRE